MKSFWLGLAGSFVGIMLLSGLAFWTDIFNLDKDGVPKFRVSDAGKVTIGATESYINLVIQNNSSEANNKVDITADLLVVENVRLENLNVSATITTTGAGGRDAGSEAASTWYYVWAITNNDGTSSNGLISASSTSPTMPSGFTKKRRVGAVRNDGGGNFLRFVQEDNRCSYKKGSDSYILSGGQATSFTTVSAASYIPPTSRTGLFLLQSASTGSVGSYLSACVQDVGAGSTNGEFYTSNVAQVTGVTASASSIGSCNVNNSQQVEYRIMSTPTSGGVFIAVVGYYDRI